MNLVFHVFSAGLACFLAWYLMRLRARVQFARDLMRSAGGHQSKVYVDSPYRFLKRLTDMMGIDFASDEKTAADRTFMKIDGAALLRICLECGVFFIRIESDNQSEQTIRISARSESSARRSEVTQKVEAAFGGRVRAEFTA